MQWYYAIGGKQVGPISENEVGLLVNKGTIGPDTWVWNKTMKDWTKYGDVETPPANVQAQSPNLTESPVQTKSPVQADPNAQAVSQKVPEDINETCSQCGLKFRKNDMIQYENNWVCAFCKPTLVQKVKEGVKVSTVLDYAGFWIRFAALFLDGLILWFIQMIIYIPFGAIFMTRFAKMAESNPSDLSNMGSIFAIYGFVWFLQISIAVAYETWFIGKYAATPGKMACRIKVITPDDMPVSYWRAFGRYFAKIVSGLILGIGYLMAAFDNEKRALHDHMCETRVVKK
jgi:uncharacterized RDD family membrane protein YckC